MRASEIDLTDHQRDALIRELRTYQPDLDCICCSNTELVRAVERARERHDEERSR